MQICTTKCFAARRGRMQAHTGPGTQVQSNSAWKLCRRYLVSSRQLQPLSCLLIHKLHLFLQHLFCLWPETNPQLENPPRGTADNSPPPSTRAACQDHKLCWYSQHRSCSTAVTWCGVAAPAYLLALAAVCLIPRYVYFPLPDLSTPQRQADTMTSAADCRINTGANAEDRLLRKTNQPQRAAADLQMDRGQPVDEQSVHHRISKAHFRREYCC